MAIEVQNGDYNLYTSDTVYNKTAAADHELELEFNVGDGTKNLNAGVGTLTIKITNDGMVVGGDEQATLKGTQTRVQLRSGKIFVASGDTITVTMESSNSNDVDVDVTVTPREVLATAIADNNTILAHADYGLAKLVRSTTPANTLSVDAANKVAVPDTQKVDVETIKARGVTCGGDVTVGVYVGSTAAASIHDAAGVVTALGTGSALTDCATATSVAVTSGTVTTLTNLPACPTDWLDATSLKTDAVTEIVTAMEASGTILYTLDGMVEDSTGDRWTEHALEQAPGVSSDVDELMLMEAISQGYHADADVVVDYAATDALRGESLATAYAAAKALTPGGVALSESNRARVFLPPWHYSVAATLDLDTEFVDLIALYPEMGGGRKPDDYDEHDGTTDLSSFRPPRTLVYSSTDNTTTVQQSVHNVHLKGFGVAQLSGDAAADHAYHAFYVSEDDNEGSRYDQMYFWHKAPHSNAESVHRFPVAFAKHVAGIWSDCIANAMAWRIGYDVANASQFSATMYNCEGGVYSFVGDFPFGYPGTHLATNCRLINCSVIGTFTIYLTDIYKGRGFAGCTSWGVPIDSSCYFENCVSDEFSFGIGVVNEGTFVNCRGGASSFGATTSVNSTGEFKGYAENCVGGPGSFGGGDGDVTENKLTGTLVNCVCEDSLGDIRAEGATIENCLLTVAANDVDCITLLDSNSKINNSTLLVVEGVGRTGIPINAASAINVTAVGNRYNNSGADGQTNGLGASVTNVGNPATVETDAASRTESKATSVTVSDKTGFSLAATGLDTIAVTAPGEVATTFPEMIVQLWRRFFKKTTLASGSLITYADDGTTAETTQAATDDGTTQTLGDAS